MTTSQNIFERQTRRHKGNPVNNIENKYKKKTPVFTLTSTEDSLKAKEALIALLIQNLDGTNINKEALTGFFSPSTVAAYTKYDREMLIYL